MADVLLLAFFAGRKAAPLYVAQKVGVVPSDVCCSGVQLLYKAWQDCVTYIAVVVHFIGILIAIWGLYEGLLIF